MLWVVQVLAVAAALLHVGIFIMESVRFTDPKVYRGVFRISEAELPAARPWAFNQGFYNLFLAVTTLVGVAILRAAPEAGWALVATGCGSMLAAAVVLVAHDRRFARGAIVQGVLPALTLLTALTQL
ncbi:DUF1304 domain-containing protein [Streptomyces gardneri]|uniref:DUF1304 domain-containing protein n=1 Tax=Nocardia TaxID=1817 RepID=UPI0013595CC2|nr:MULTISPECIES: DUF1304 domain-containing protein [Nocardia]MBF6165705.1 DUF1304 domain-containing protein [Streptomyces gardneri]MBF6203030.1 DUF1304 domain-containing protein [Streptomyces gardneri]